MKNFKPKRVLTKLKTETILPLISDGMSSSSDLVDGRFVPIVIVDTTNNKSVQDVVHLHRFTDPGDVDSLWGIGDDDSICLFLEFKKPVKTEAIIKFNILKHGGLVDTIMSTKVMHLQPGKEGDRPSSTQDNPSITIELPDEGLRILFTERWKKVLRNDLKNKGLSRREAKQASQKIIDEWRRVFGISLKEHAMNYCKWSLQNRCEPE